ncbi:MAG: transcriptional regulator [Gammaproteobacteria bacterium]|nr:transcriptional regulator [Gammaproteobacteria bacterium]
MPEQDPKCPSCGITGIAHFASKRSTQSSKTNDPWFFVVYCDNCGHVHAIMPKHVFAETTTRVVVRETADD